MAAVDDIYNQITRNSRKRSGRSFFPAANAQGQTIQFSGSSTPTRVGTGFGPNNGLLPPDQNPAYQAAIAKGRPARSGYTMIQTPSGGSIAVPVGQTRKYTDLLFKGNPTADTGFQRPSNQAAYALGDTGAVPTGNTPFEKSYRMGYEGGPVNAAPSAGIGYQVGQFASNIPSALGGFGRNIASWFGGGNLPSIPATASAAQPTPTPYQTPSPSPTPTATPFKIADGRSDLLKDAENTFYGGGNAPIPTPTPTPMPNLMAYNPPRRYSDLGYY